MRRPWWLAIVICSAMEPSRRPLDTLAEIDFIYAIIKSYMKVRSDGPSAENCGRALPTHVRQIVGTRDSATLVRGVDRFGNFKPEYPPESDLSDTARAFHAHVMGDQQQVLMKDARSATLR
jgi:hypothetical protein